MEKKRLFRIFDPDMTYGYEYLDKHLNEETFPLEFFDSDGNRINLDALPVEHKECLLLKGHIFYYHLSVFGSREEFRSCMGMDRSAFDNLMSDYRDRFCAFIEEQEKKEKEPFTGLKFLDDRFIPDAQFCRLVTANLDTIFRLYLPFNPELVRKTLAISLTLALLEIDGILESLFADDAASVLQKTLNICLTYQYLMADHKTMHEVLTKWDTQKKAANVRHKDNQEKRAIFEKRLVEHVKAHGTKDIIAKFDRPIAEELGIKPETASVWRQRINRSRKMSKN